MLVVFALAFGLAAIGAAVATTMPVWAALLVVFGALFVVAALLGAIGVALLKKGAPPVPRQALEEAKLTAEALRNGHQD